MNNGLINNLPIFYANYSQNPFNNNNIYVPSSPKRESNINSISNRQYLNRISQSPSNPVKYHIESHKPKLNYYPRTPSPSNNRRNILNLNNNKIYKESFNSKVIYRQFNEFNYTANNLQTNLNLIKNINLNQPINYNKSILNSFPNIPIKKDEDIIKRIHKKRKIIINKMNLIKNNNHDINYNINNNQNKNISLEINENDKTKALNNPIYNNNINEKQIFDYSNKNNPNIINLRGINIYNKNHNYHSAINIRQVSYNIQNYNQQNFNLTNIINNNQRQNYSNSNDNSNNHNINQNYFNSFDSKNNINNIYNNNIIQQNNNIFKNENNNNLNKRHSYSISLDNISFIQNRQKSDGNHFNRNFSNEIYLNYNNTEKNKPVVYNIIQNNQQNYKNIIPIPMNKHHIYLDGNKIKKSLKEIEQIQLVPQDNFNLNEFKIIKQIGEGAFGKIYCVKWIKNNSLYAIKMLNLLRSELSSFQEKIKVIRNLVKNTGLNGLIKIYGDKFVFQKDKDECYYYYIMELGEKDWLKDIKMREKYHLYYSEYELFNIISQLVKTLALMQKNNISHRDIKPQNVILCKEAFKLCDFGEIKVLPGNGKIFQSIRGSELYMSPILVYSLKRKEQNALHNAYKSDVFSLGMCLLYAIFFSRNFLCDIKKLNDMDIISRIISKALNNRYSQNIINLVIKMINIDENLRPDFIELEEYISSIWHN